ncbi:MAG TPA: hypothetical protein ENK57_15835 [Polyangiaceae bacterium]|nr:hypothetical protein [Polyangiaceae bacterium]
MRRPVFERLGRALVGMLLTQAVACGTGSTQPTTSLPEVADCVVRRAAFDIGSGTTKVKVADVNLCDKTLDEILLAEDAPVFYGVDVADPYGDGFRQVTKDRGFAALASFRARAEAYEPEAYAAVATAAFRRARNAPEFIARIERELEIPVNLIAQAREARLGFLGAVRSAHVVPERAVVWDVGGSSMQMTALNDDGRLVIYEGSLASGQMREHVVHHVQGKGPDVTSPNPVSHDEAAAARSYAEAYAAENVDARLRDKLSDPDTVVIGIGALKYYGNRPANQPGATCSSRGLQVRIADLLGKSDDQIGGDYAATQVSDRLLLLGFMQALGIQEVHLVDVDLTDGLLLESEFWPRVVHFSDSSL